MRIKGTVDCALPPDFTITVAEKTRDHPLFGQGSPLGYVVNGVEGATIKLQRGQVYRFLISTEGHPFYFTNNTVGGGRGWTLDLGGGLVKVESGMFEVTIGSNVSEEFYYHCALHDSMGGRVLVTAIDCMVCGKPAQWTCGTCTAPFCSQLCQKKEWSSGHHQRCRVAVFDVGER